MPVDQVARDRLIEEHLGYVRALAIQISKELAARIDLDDLIAYGMRGLVEAAERFDAARGVGFSTFSYYRIRGAIFDGLRKTGWLGRSQYAKFAAASNEYLRNVGEREAPADAGAAASGGANAARDLADTLGDVAAIFLTSLSSATREELPDTEHLDAAARLERADLAVVLHEALQHLPGKERHLIELYYFEELTLEDAGKQMGLSKSWSSRLHARAVRLLAEELRARTQ